MNTRSEGFTVIEVVISVMLLGIILTLLGGLTFASARMAVVSGDRAQQQAFTLELVNRYAGLPYDSLTNGYTYVDSAGSANNWVRRTVRVTRSGNTATVMVVSTPRQRRITPDTVRFTRAAPATVNPLWTP